jgi:hypothetical protein
VGHRKLAARERERDEVHESPAPTPEAKKAEPARQGVRERLLSLQRSHGNAAVTVAVQRRETAASTDAPGYKAPKKKAPPKKEAAAEDYAPTARDPGLANWELSALSTEGMKFASMDGAGKNELSRATELLEEYWFRSKDRGGAMQIARVYQKLHDDKRYAFWMGVSNGSIKPGVKPAEDMSDKAF